MHDAEQYTSITLHYWPGHTATPYVGLLRWFGAHDMIMACDDTC